jgi:GT2 family glycosyltransferase
MTSPIQISVVICSYNRCQSLVALLRSLWSHPSLPTAAWDVLVVDNNSADGTRKAVESLIEDGFTNLNYVFEGRQGKSFALNTGVKESKGKILAFTDDDCIVGCNWLPAILKEFEADPDLEGIGGRVELYDTTAPIAHRTYRQRTIILRPDQAVSMIIGCNMAFRRSVFNLVGGFDPGLGPGSEFGAVFEDIDFLYRVYKAKLKILYSPDVLVHHNHRRSTGTQVEKARKGYLIGRGAFYCKHILACDRDVLKFAYWQTASLFGSLVGDVLKRKPMIDQRKALWALFLGATYQFTRSVSPSRHIRARRMSK